MLSIVIPVLNEAPSLPALYEEIREVADTHGLVIEVIFVDDGSTDGSWEAISRIAAADARVRGIRFRRNFGKAAALTAGFDEALGDWILTMDADLQDDPHEIPRFLDEMKSGFDVVSGWKKVRRDPWTKVAPSRVFNWMVRGLTGVKLHDHNCGMKCYRRAVFDEVRLYGEMHRFVPVLAAARGFRVGELAIQHRPRRFGRSKYGGTRFVKGFLDLLTVAFLTGYRERPQHVFGTIGLAAIGLGLLGAAGLGVGWLAGQADPAAAMPPLYENPALYVSLGLLLFGGQMLATGMIGELIVAQHDRSLRTFSISDRTDAAGERGRPAAAEKSAVADAAPVATRSP